MNNLQDPFILSIDEEGHIYDCKSYYRLLSINELIALKMAIDKTYNYYLNDNLTDEEIYDRNIDSSEIYQQRFYEYAKSIPKRQKDDRGYIYLMKDNRNGLIKIGYSKYPEFREKTLQSEVPDIEMIYYNFGRMKLEKELHKSYNHKRIRGEWFDLNNNDIEQIKVHIDGTSF
jgi:hypothetical protein